MPCCCIEKWLQMWIVRLQLHSEMEGRWPDSVGISIIVLIPKSEGGYRPIGLLPWAVRLWMRCRRNTIQQWEATVT